MDEASKQILAADHLCAGAASPADLERGRALGLPDDVLAFYAFSGGAYLHAVSEGESSFECDGRSWMWRIRPLAEVRSVVEEYELRRKDSPLFELLERWLVLVDVGDGNCLAIDTAPAHRGEVIDGFHETIGAPGENTVIALSFSEALRDLLRAPVAYWLEEERQEYRVI